MTWLVQIVKGWRSALLIAVVLAFGTVSQAQGLPVLHVGAGPADQAVPIFYAAKAGLYRKLGLDVQVVKLANGAAIAAAIAGGSADLGQAAPLSIVIAHSKGLPFTVVGNLSEYDSARHDTALLVPVDSPIKSPKDLEGKTLGVAALNDLVSISMFAWMDERGVDRSTLKIVEMPASAMLAAMEQKRIDAAAFFEPFFSSFMASGKVRILGYPYDAIANRFSSSVLFGEKTWVAAHPDLVERFVWGTQQGAEYISTHETESAQLMADFADLDVNTLPKVRHAVRGTAIGPSDLQPVIDAAVKYKVIAQPFPAQELLCTCAPKR